jgi:hypothetical protein
MYIYKTVLWAIIVGILGLTACSQPAESPVDPATRQTHCSACNETFTLPPGYLGTLSEDDIHYTATGIPVFTCPECGEQSASPVPPELPATEGTP